MDRDSREVGGGDKCPGPGVGGETSQIYFEANEGIIYLKCKNIKILIAS